MSKHSLSFNLETESNFLQKKIATTRSISVRCHFYSYSYQKI